MAYPGQTSESIGDVDYPGQTTKIEKKILDAGVDYH